MYALAPSVLLIVSWCAITLAASNGIEIYETQRKLGVDEDKMIVGGRDVTRGKERYPWFARLGKPNNNDWEDEEYRWSSCGGSLVSPEYVLTAAHCASKDIFLDENAGFMIGALCNEEGNCKEEQEWRGIDSVIIHPDFEKDWLSHDVALIRLKEPSTQLYVELDEGLVSARHHKKKLWAVGFGDTKYQQSNNDYSCLKHARLSHVPNDKCAKKFKNMDTPPINEYVMCAGSAGKSACQGDSGGPLYDRQNKVLVGVISWGIRCGEAGHPGVYARVSSEYDWIVGTICNNHGSSLPSFCEGFEWDEDVESASNEDDELADEDDGSDHDDESDHEDESNDNDEPDEDSEEEDGGEEYDNGDDGNGESGGDESCPSDHVLFTVDLQPDGDNEAIFFNLKVAGKKQKLLDEAAIQPFTLQSHDICIYKDELHQFTITDYKRDGLCCDQGLGYYELFCNGNSIHFSTFENGKKKKLKEKVKFTPSTVCR